jgi:hypothetical protein
VQGKDDGGGLGLSFLYCCSGNKLTSPISSLFSSLLVLVTIIPQSQKTRKSGKASKSGPASVVNASTLSSGMVSTLQSLHKRLQALEPVMVERKDVKVSVPKLIGTGKRGIHHSNAKSTFVTLSTKLGGSASGANAANAAIFNLTPGTSSEFAGFAGLYDDWRTTHLEFFIAVGFSVTASGINTTVQNQLCFIGAVYDPVDNTALISVVDAMDYDHRIGPFKAGYDGVNSPNDISKGGLHSLKCKIPAPVVDPGILSDLLDSNWVSTKDTAVVVGYIKAYCEAAGALTSSTISGFVRFHVEFRSRR